MSYLDNPIGRCVLLYARVWHICIILYYIFVKNDFFFSKIRRGTEIKQGVYIKNI